MIKVPKMKNEKNTVKELVAIDLGTQSAKIGIFHIEHEVEKIQLIGHSAVEFNNTNPAELHEEDQEDLIQKLKEGLEKAKSFSNSNPKKLIIGIPSTNLSNQTTTVRIKRIKPEEKIGKKEVEDLTEKITASAKAEAYKQLNQKNENFEDEIEILNSDITFVKIDGYITKELEGFRGSVLEVSLFTSFAPVKFLNKLVNLSNRLNLNLITITTDIYALNKALKLKGDSNYILVDIGGKNTDIAIVFAGEILKITNFKLGGESFLNYISLLTTLDKEEVRKYTKNENIESLNTEKHENVLQFKNEITKVWCVNFKSSLEGLEGIKVYPEEILVYGIGGDMLEKKQMLENIGNLKFKKAPLIKSLQTESLDFFTDQTGKLEGNMLNVLALGKFGSGVIT